MSKRILLADDDAGIIDAVKMMLEDEGYGVDVTFSGADVRNLHQDLPAVIVLDIWLAGEDGRDICRYLKAQEATKHVPIILFSASTHVQQIAQEVGADDFLLKPFHIDTLLEKVQQFVLL